MTRWILIRHGQSEANQARTLSGWKDVPLTALGREQARAVGVRIAGEPIDQVLSSDLIRAADTARIAMDAWTTAHRDRPPIVCDPRLRERDLGCLQGVSLDQARADGRIAALLGWETAPEGGESLRDVLRRSIEALDERDGAGACIAVFAHGGVIRGLTGLLDGLPLHAIGVRRIANAVPIVVDLAPRTWRAHAERVRL